MTEYDVMLDGVATGVDEKVFMIIILVYLLVYLVLGAIVLANYIMTAMSLFKIAKRRKVNYAWLAWIPVLDNFIVGGIADEYDGRNGLRRKWKVVLTVLSIVGVCGISAGYVSFLGSMLSWAIEHGSTEPPVSMMLGVFASFFVLLLVGALAATATYVIRWICMFKVFESTVPDKAVLYLVLSILVPLAQGICLLRCRDKTIHNSQCTIHNEVDYNPQQENV